LKELNGQLPPTYQLVSDPEVLGMLTQIAIDTRYPHLHLRLDPAYVVEALQLASDILTAIADGPDSTLLAQR
jgi:hypothetical protein